ncbi:MAG: glycosyltransferase family 4 protein [Verrucomicrobia bacterium]|nr:glycosyltransferase family 4 protein [Verrucomicrobiota bacterium]MBU1736217.1 glycosyltransferase family 4 protein [Verrucomicrobiota bacterium]MBU1857396.1 glycosyltransferase family 4 protein [Verrucomicrobiota bacterium]
MSVLSVMGLLGVLALATSYFGVAAVRRVAERCQFLDIPNERSSHTRPTPQGGGLAIVTVVLGGLWFYAALCPGVPWLALGIFTVGTVLIACVSGWDDLHSLPVWVRFTAHGLAAVLVILAFGYWHAVGWPGLGGFSLGLFGVLLTFLWIVGLTNAYNFMDGIDGIAGGQAVVAGLGWAILGWISGQPLVGVMGLLIAAASLGFLGHNWPPARIVMGDVGSAFLGFSFAALTVLASQSNPVFVLTGIALIWPFVFDAVFTFARRLCRGEKVWAAHRSHLYQRLIISGLSHGQVSGLYIGLAMLGLVWAVALVQGWQCMAVVGAVVVAVAALSLWVWTCQRERAGNGLLSNHLTGNRLI